MDRPYSISDFALPSRWDSDSRPSVIERAGRSRKRRQNPHSSRSRKAFRFWRVPRLRPIQNDLSRPRPRILAPRFGSSYAHRSGQVSRRASRRPRPVRIPRRPLAWKPTSEICAKHGLVEQRTIEGHSSYSTKVLTLTKEGQRLLERCAARLQSAGDLSRLCEAQGSAPRRRSLPALSEGRQERSNAREARFAASILDFELKKDLYQALSRMRPDKNPAYERISIANQFDLKVVNDKIPIPDLRIEYEDECRDVRRLDLEIATRDYRPQGLGEKAKAGFHVFARQQDHAKLRRVLDTQEITARIFAL